MNINNIFKLNFQLIIFISLAFFINIFNCSSNSNSDGGIDASSDDNEISDLNHFDVESDYHNDTEFDIQDDASNVELKITSVEPDHGPYTGDTQIQIRGRGFISPFKLWWNNEEINQSDYVIEDSHRINLKTPSHEPGYVSVKIANDNDQYILENAFWYESWYLQPDSGSIAGGTFITISGKIDFSSDSIVYFGDSKAVEISVVDSNTITCKTPPGYVGPVNVSIEGSTLSEKLILENGFTYYDPGDPSNGGLSGGEINGWIDITVYDYYSRDRLPGSVVILISEDGTKYQGITDSRGQITFSGPQLSGKQTITAAHEPIELEDGYMEPFESVTIVSFNARNVNLYLTPLPPPEVGPINPGQKASQISGELLFSNGEEFAPGSWDDVPQPLDDEVKKSYVFTTSGSLWGSPQSFPRGDAVVDETKIGTKGYTFTINTGSGTIGLYALGGLKNDISDDFIPFIMGLKKGIQVEVESEVSGIEIYMTHFLDQYLSVRLENPPLSGPSGNPNIYGVNLVLNLGNDGNISRPDSKLRSSNPYSQFWFGALPSLINELSGSSYDIVAGTYTLMKDPATGELEETNPYSVVVRHGIVDLNSEIVINELLGIPWPSDPLPGTVASGGYLSWIFEGNEPDFFELVLQVPGTLRPTPYWRVILPGNARDFTIPDLELLAGINPTPEGNIVWQLWCIKTDQLNYNEWTYRYTSQSYWSGYSVDAWYIRLK